jgi:hypothetical protein
MSFLIYENLHLQINYRRQFNLRDASSECRAIFPVRIFEKIQQFCALLNVSEE